MAEKIACTTASPINSVFCPTFHHNIYSIYTTYIILNIYIICRRTTCRDVLPTQCSGWEPRVYYGWCTRGTASAGAWDNTHSTRSLPIEGVKH